MSFLITFFSGLLFASLLEYLFHRFKLHDTPENNHIQIHHKNFHGATSYEIKTTLIQDIISSKADILTTCILYFPLALVISTENITLAIFFYITCSLYSLWSEFLHFSFHIGLSTGIGRFFFFNTLKEHHKVHHYCYNKNFGIGTNFWDIVFRTKKYSKKTILSSLNQ